MSEFEIVEIGEDEGEKWITVNGSHVKVNSEGNVVAGANGKLSKKNESISKNKNSKLDNAKADLAKKEKELADFKDNYAKKQESKSKLESATKSYLEAKSKREETEKRLSDSQSRLAEKKAKRIEAEKRTAETREKARRIIEGLDSFGAMDKSERHKDNNGHLVVNRTVITKAAVNPYSGSSIPRWQELGLDPDKVYNLLRDPEELRKALPTFKAIPLMIRHVPIDASSPETESVIGAIGSEFEMDEEGRVWSLIRVTTQEGIDYIESTDDSVKLGELSAGYAYDADMTSGTFNGVPYDGIMRNIHGNHVAIVERGRIGSDAIIADSIEGQLMAKKIVMAKGELAKLQKQLGMDSAEDVKKAILAVHASSKMALDEDDKKAEDEDDKKSDAEDEEVEIVEDSEDDKKAKDEDKQTQADKDNESEAMRLKEREKREEKDRNRDKAQAQDSALAMDALEKSVISRFQGINSALRSVEPLVGVLAMDGFDSEHSVLEYALKQKGIKTDGINTDGLRLAVELQKGNSKSNIAMDSDAYSAPSSIFAHIKTV